jgi:hypothetical protein
METVPCFEAGCTSAATLFDPSTGRDGLSRFTIRYVCEAHAGPDALPIQSAHEYVNQWMRLAADV